MSSDYYGGQAGELADQQWECCGDEIDWPDLNAEGIARCTRNAGHDDNHEDWLAGVWWPKD